MSVVDERILREAATKKGYNEGWEKGIKEGMEEGIKEGMEKGIKEGMEKGLHNTARNMKQKGMATDFIAEMTGLSVDVIESL